MTNIASWAMRHISELFPCIKDNVWLAKALSLLVFMNLTIWVHDNYNCW